MIFWMALGCERSRPTPTEPGTIQAGQAQSRQFGGDYDSFVAWSDTSSRFAILYAFSEDTDHDGKIRAALGDHGEVLGDEPTPILFDIDKDTQTRLQNTLSASPDGRYYLFKRQDSLRVLDAFLGVETDLKADPSPDNANPCLPSREGRFDPSSQHLGYFRESPTPQFVVRDLRSGHERQTPADGLWRAEPTPVFDWILRADATTPPRVSGTCACRWCVRFASSIGQYRFTGSADRSLMRTDGVAAKASSIPIARNWLTDGKTLTSVLGEAAPCQALGVFLGAPKALIRCKEGLQLLDLNTMTHLPLPAVSVSNWITPSFADHKGKFAAVWLREGQKRHIAGLNLDTGEVTPGPVVTRVTPAIQGWVTAASHDRVWAFNITTGEAKSIKAKALTVKPLNFKTATGWTVIDPDAGRFIRTPNKPTHVGATGCFLKPARKSGKMFRGPWNRVCPR